MDPVPRYPPAALATLHGTHNTVPSFITANGPVREVRFTRMAPPDGGVHDLFVIVGRYDSPTGCRIRQTDFATQLARRNLSFRIPELELFKKYGRDHEKARFFRDVLNDIPPAPLEELHEQRRQLASMLDRMNALQNEARQLCGEVNSRVYCHWERAFYARDFDRQAMVDEPSEVTRGHSTGPLMWDLLEDQWVSGFYPGHAVLHEFSERPKKSRALTAWNSFVVAFGRAPERMFYGHGDGYYAVYRDVKGRVVIVLNNRPTRAL